MGSVRYALIRKCDEVAAAATEKVKIDDAMALVAAEKTLVICDIAVLFYELIFITE